MKKKGQKLVIRHVKTIGGYILFTLVISQLLTALTGFTIVDPLLNKIGPRSVSIEPINFPTTQGENQVIRINIINDGLRTIKGLNVEYQLKCEFDNFKKAEIHSKTLKKDESDFFEFEADLNVNCSIGTDPSLIKFYSDIEGNCYVQFEDKISDICQYCELEIIVFEGYEKIGNLTYWYPFSEGGWSLGGEITSGCLLYELAENKSELKPLYERDVKMTFYVASIGCIRGDIEKEWCAEYYPEVYE